MWDLFAERQTLLDSTSNTKVILRCTHRGCTVGLFLAKIQRVMVLNSYIHLLKCENRIYIQKAWNGTEAVSCEFPSGHNSCTTLRKLVKGLALFEIYDVIVRLPNKQQQSCNYKTGAQSVIMRALAGP